MEIVQYKCPNCGANLSFSAEKQGFDCEYCFSFFTEEEIKKAFAENENMALDENVEEQQQNNDEFAEHNNLYSCPNCGAEIVSEDTTSATFCYYCHNPVILSGRLSGDFRPDKVIPFKIEKNKAIDTFKEWSGKKWFVPAAFHSKGQIEKMTAIYVPFWLADCMTDAQASAIGKQIRTWTEGEYQCTETTEYAVERQADIRFKGVPVDGASKIENKLMEAIEPFNYSDLKDFSMSYLSGFLAQKYDEGKAEVFPRVKERVEQGMDSIIRSSMNYDSVNIVSKNNRILKTDWQYSLMPVWFLNFKYNDEDYSFAMNGQTGKMAGRLPVSKGKVFGFIAGVTAVLTAIITLGGYLLS